MPPLKSAELHRLARQELGPRLTALGFKKAPKASVASWARPENGRWLVMWLQPSQGNDSYSAGFTFTVEFALSSGPVTYGNGYRERLPTLLTDQEREELRQIENRTKAKLPPPNAAIAEMLPALTREHWRAGWNPRATPYDPTEDVWFRHGDGTDAQELMAFFQRVLPSAISRFLERAAAAS